MMSNNVINIDESRPHITLNCGKSVHVVPVSLIEDVISGKINFSDIEQCDLLIKPILRDWLNSL